MQQQASAASGERFWYFRGAVRLSLSHALVVDSAFAKRRPSVLPQSRCPYLVCSAALHQLVIRQANACRMGLWLLVVRGELGLRCWCQHGALPAGNHEHSVLLDSIGGALLYSTSQPCASHPTWGRLAMQPRPDALPVRRIT
jgi:hypothetical protein